ncbi:MAG: mechanosensitive ion channel [Oscillospiraceae bacterium]|nr:mechanosensitive ion channel [Oscillospiraceae bacterium]
MSETLEQGQETLRETAGLFSKIWDKVVSFLPTLLMALCIFLAGILIARLITKIISRAMSRSKIDGAASSFGQSVVKIMLYAILLIICLSVLGVPTASMITVVGAAGVAIGLALQNTLSNLAGGFILMLAKPFQAGDFIRTGAEEGFVESVSILYTKLRTMDNHTVFIPNSAVSSGAVTNLSQRGRIRVRVQLSVSYAADIRKTRAVLLKAVSGLETVLKKPAPAVAVTELAESGIELTVFAWVRNTDFITAPAAVRECCKYALDQAGIEIPYPQIDVHTKE